MAYALPATKTHPKPKRIHVIVNPAPATRAPLLGIFNHAFREAGIEWDLSLTHKAGDGERLAREALDRGAEVVVAYGGDGTIVEVASGLLETEVPLLILAGGTGNLVASELRLPMQVEKACDLLCGDTFKTRLMDVGMMGRRPFLLRIGCGLEVGVVQEATRELKDQFGKLAYVYAGIKMLSETPETHYELLIDGKEKVSASGVACFVANVGTVGLGRLVLSPSVDISDGKLDVFFIKKANIEGILQMAGKMVGLERNKKEEEDIALDASQAVSHWRVDSVLIASDPVMDVQVDGDVVAKTPQTIRVLPSALRVVV